MKSPPITLVARGRLPKVIWPSVPHKRVQARPPRGLDGRELELGMSGGPNWIVRDLLTKLRASEACQRRDLVDSITLLIATGLRRSELLALRWSGYADTGTIAVTGKLVRQGGVGLSRIDDTKTAAGRRIIPLPSFAIAVLNDRRVRPYVGQQEVIFASSKGTLRDRDNFGAAWRAASNELGVPDVTSHSFRKTVATLIDDAGLSARIGADHLGHAKVSMTQDRIHVPRAGSHSGR